MKRRKPFAETMFGPDIHLEKKISSSLTKINWDDSFHVKIYGHKAFKGRRKEAIAVGEQAKVLCGRQEAITRRENKLTIWASSKLKASSHQKTPLRKWNGKPQTGRNHWQSGRAQQCQPLSYDRGPKYIRSTQNSGTSSINKHGAGIEELGDMGNVKKMYSLFHQKGK